MREISLVEAEAVSGAWGVPGAVAGGAAGAAAYIGTAVGPGTFKGSEFAGAVITGAAVGAVMGPVGVGRTLATTAMSYPAGILGGSASRAFGSSGI